MSLFLKNLKISVPPEDFNYYQTICKNYNKIYKNLIEGNNNSKVIPYKNETTPGSSNKSDTTSGSSNLNVNSIDSNISNNIFKSQNYINGELIREKVIQWFFSLSIESRIKITTLESSFISNIIHQMHSQHKLDSKILFQQKSDIDENCTELSKEKISFITGGLNLNSDHVKLSEDDIFQKNILNYFNFKSSRPPHDQNMVDNIWFADVKFFSVNTNLDCITLSPRVLKDDALFNFYFKYIGNNKSFLTLIKPFQDPKTKFYGYNLPEWMDPKAYYGIGHYLMALFEQAILVKFVLNYNKKEKLVFSLRNEKKFSEFFQRRREVIECLLRYFDNEKKLELFDHVSPKGIFNEIFYHPQINQIINNKPKQFQLGYMNYLTNKQNPNKEMGFFAKTDLETEKKMISKYKNEHPIIFVDDCLYHSFESIWQKLYYMSMRLFEDLYEVYSKKNYQELIEDMEKNEKKKKDSNKKAKKTNKQEEVSTIKKKSSKNDNNPECTDDDLYSIYLQEAKIQTNYITYPNISLINSSNDKTLTNKSCYNFNLDNKTNLQVVSKEKNNVTITFVKHENKLQNYLYDNYLGGQKNIINDFIKNYILKDIITKAVEKGEENNVIKEASFKTLMDDLFNISSKSKMISNILVENNNKQKIANYFESIISSEVEEHSNKNQTLINNKQEELIQTKSQEVTMNEIISNPVNNISENKTDDVNLINFINENDNNLAVNIEESNFDEKEKPPLIEVETKDKKKKKTAGFFLYETCKKKREKPFTKPKPSINSTRNENSSNATNSTNATNATSITSTTNASNTNNAYNAFNASNSSNANNSYKEVQISSKSNNNSIRNNNETESFGYKKSNYNENEFPNDLETKSYRKNTVSTRTPPINKLKNNQNNYYRNRDSPPNYRNKNNYSYNRNLKTDKNENKSCNYFIVNSFTHNTNINSRPGLLIPINHTIPIIPMNSINPRSPLTMNQKNDSDNKISHTNMNFSNINSLVSSVNFCNYSNEFLTFVYKLHNDIVSYHKYVNQTLEAMKEIKVFLIKYIEKLINEILFDNFIIDVYGSFASDLSIESSDIDVKLRLKSNDDEFLKNFDLNQSILLIVKNFSSLSIFESVIPIYTSSVPIIKIVCDPKNIADDDNKMRLEEFRNSEFYFNYKFNKEEIEKIKIDLTFLDIIGKLNYNVNSHISNNHISSVEFTKNIMFLHPEIKPVLQVLKRFLQIKNLNSCYNGGLSSFCLFLIILAFVKFKSNTNTEKNQINLGRLLIDFLEFYGKIFNFHNTLIDVNLPNPYVLNSEIYDRSPIILDPLSYLNASKSSFRIDEVRNSFSEGLEFLNVYKLKYDKIDVNVNSSNIIYDLFLKK